MSENVEEVGQVTEQLQELEERVSRLGTIREQLLDRLREVSRDDPEVAKVDEPPLVTLVPMASDVRSLVGRVSMECDFLESILSRLEV